jgi:hypothetical protein
MAAAVGGITYLPRSAFGPGTGAPEAMRKIHASPAATLARFDRLDPVESDALPGLWRGEEVATGHPLDGLLTALRWYGKAFFGDGRAQPLVFEDAAGGRFAVDPPPLPVGVLLRAPGLAVGAAIRSAPLLRPLLHAFRAGAPVARVAVRECRGRTGASLIYQRLPIVDVFRQADERTLLGMMVTPLCAEPYFFTLRRVSPDVSPDSAR